MSFIYEKTKFENVKEFVLYSDNCSGQNRNKMVFNIMFNIMFYKTTVDFDINIIHRLVFIIKHNNIIFFCSTFMYLYLIHNPKNKK